MNLEDKGVANIYWVDERLAFGGLSAAAWSDKQTAVLTVCEEKPSALPTASDYFHHGFPDCQPFPVDKILDCVRWIEARIKRGDKVIVHCAEGNSRSVSVVIAYLLSRGDDLAAIKARIVREKPFLTVDEQPTQKPLFFQEEFLSKWQAYIRAHNPLPVDSATPSRQYSIA